MLTADFTKITLRKTGGDTVRGTIYSFENRLMIRVVSPISQYMAIDSAATLIYNTAERSAVRFRRKGLAFLPFFQTFAAFFRRDRAVPDENFRIRETSKKGDSLVTQWVPSNSRGPFRGRIETVYRSDRPVRVDAYDARERLAYRMIFSCDSLLSGRHVPLRILSLTPQNADTLREEVTFGNVRPGRQPPDEILNFSLPQGTAVKELEW